MLSSNNFFIWFFVSELRFVSACWKEVQSFKQPRKSLILAQTRIENKLVLLNHQFLCGTFKNKKLGEKFLLKKTKNEVNTTKNKNVKMFFVFKTCPLGVSDAVDAKVSFIIVRWLVDPTNFFVFHKFVTFRVSFSSFHSFFVQVCLKILYRPKFTKVKVQKCSSLFSSAKLFRTFSYVMFFHEVQNLLNWKKQKTRSVKANFDDVIVYVWSRYDVRNIKQRTPG